MLLNCSIVSPPAPKDACTLESAGRWITSDCAMAQLRKFLLFQQFDSSLEYHGCRVLKKCSCEVFNVYYEASYT